MNRIPITLAVFAVAIGVALLAASFTPLSQAFLSPAHAQTSPSVAIDLSPSGPVEEGTAITVTMSFLNLEQDSDRSTTDYIFRADVVDADGCEEQAGGYGLGVDRKINLVDEDPETRRGTISAGCPAGVYTLRASISDSGAGELAAATAGFSVTEAPSDDATLRSLALSGVDIGAFDPATTTYAAGVANGVEETTITPTVNDGGATYVVKLDDVADEDGNVSLAVGGNVITIEVTAEDGEATETYTVTVTRAEALSSDATLSSLALSGIDFGVFNPATTEYTASVASGVTETTVTAAVNDGGATYVVQLDGVDDADGTVELAVGDNTVSVVVTAEDGQASRTYAVTVTRAEPPSTDARLDSLALSDVNFGAFDPATTGYAAAVGNDVEQTTVTARTNDGRATHMVQLDGVPDADGTVPLAVGENVISVLVTAEDGQTTMTYTVAVTRAAAGPTPEDSPETPDAPAGEVTGEGQVQLDWNDVEDASYYQVRFCCGSADWVTLPTGGIEVVFDGSRAAVSNLPDYGIYYFSVRAGNTAGVSEWSDYLTLSNAD